MATIPDFPFPTDDSGEGDDGTEVNLEWTEELEAALVAVIYGEDNPGIPASVIVDEVIEARNGEVSLDERITNAVVGVDNPGVSAADIIDEVVEARDDNPDLNDRLDNFVADEIADATTDTRGLLSDGTTSQSITGDKVFEDDINVEGELTVDVAGVVAPLPRTLVRDLTHRQGTGTGETDITSFTLPANALDAVGKGVRIQVWGKYGTTGTSTFKLYWGGTAIISFTTGNNDAPYAFEAYIYREDTAKQTAMVNYGNTAAGALNTTTGLTRGALMASWDSSNAAMQKDMTAPIIIKTTLQDTVDGSVLTQLACIIELIG